MSTDKPAFPESGGSYTVDPGTGDLIQTVAPTADHPDGNRPRPAQDAVDNDAVEAGSKPKKGGR